MSAAGHVVLEAARVQANMSFTDLWLAYFGLGGVAQPAELRSCLRGRARPVDYDVIAQAINERFLERGANHPLPYEDELEPSAGA